MRNTITALFLLSIIGMNAQIGYYPFSKPNENRLNRWGIINSNKEVVMKPTFKNEISFFYNHESDYPVAKFRTYEKKYGLLNRKGEVLLEPSYKVIYPSENTEIIFLKNNNLLHIYNTRLENIIIKNLNYNDTSITIDQSSITIIDRLKDSRSIYSLVGKLISEESFKEDENEEYDMMSFGLETSEAESDITAILDKLSSLDEKIEIIKTYLDPYFYAIASKGAKKGILNSEGKNLLDFQYDRLELINAINIKTVKTEFPYQKVGLFSLEQKKEVFKPQFGNIQSASKIFNKYEGLRYAQITLFDYFFVSKDDHEGYVSAINGQIFLPVNK